MGDINFLDDEKERRSPLSLEKKLTRDEIMLLESELILSLHKRSTAFVFKPSQHDSPRLKYAWACISAIKSYCTLLKDHELTQLDKRVGELEQGRLTENGDH